MKNLSKFYIAGEWVNPISDDIMPVLNPATEEQIGTVALGNTADVDNAVAAAKSAFNSFSLISKADRLALLNKLKSVTENIAALVNPSVPSCSNARVLRTSSTARAILGWPQMYTFAPADSNSQTRSPCCSSAC